MRLLRLIKIITVGIRFGLEEFILGHVRSRALNIPIRALLFWRRIRGTPRPPPPRPPPAPRRPRPAPAPRSGGRASPGGSPPPPPPPPPPRRGGPGGGFL